MQAIAFYLTYPFIYLIASLPFWLLYRVSDVLFWVLWASGYRKKVVLTNIRNSFTSKTEAQVKAICKAYFRYLCDLIMETLKTLKMTEAETNERCTFQKSPWLDTLYEQRRSFIIVMGHYGNWEWAGPAFSLTTKFQLVVIYRPLTNPWFEKMMSGMRTKFGTRITPVNQTLRDMVANRKKLTATAFIADQTAFAETAHWMTFLNQDTAVFTGAEKLAVKFDYPVVFMNIQRLRRGYYHVTPELLFDKPKETQPGEICEVFTRRLEKEINADPVIWLWSHRRWKYKRPVEEAVAHQSGLPGSLG